MERESKYLVALPHVETAPSISFQDFQDSSFLGAKHSPPASCDRCQLLVTNGLAQTRLRCQCVVNWWIDVNGTFQVASAKQWSKNRGCGGPSQESQCMKHCYDQRLTSKPLRLTLLTPNPSLSQEDAQSLHMLSEGKPWKSPHVQPKLAQATSPQNSCPNRST